VNSVKGENDFVCFVVADREAQILAKVELELELSELIGRRLSQIPRSLPQPYRHLLSCSFAD
jgi:hypothetical protein